MVHLRGPSVDFASVAAALAEVRTRPEISVRATPGPAKLAPHALALTAEVASRGEQIADGRLVILHDPAGQESWGGGTWRLILFASADLEQEMSSDPVLNALGWSWLEEALGERDLAIAAFGGTVTRTESHSFGVLDDRPPSADLEIRASWTPVVEADHPSLPDPSVAAIITEHVLAWLDLLALITSLEPLSEGVVRLHRGRPG